MSEKPECTVCLEEYLPTPLDRPASLACGHFIHHRCLEKIFATKDSESFNCPICRSPILPSDVRLLYGNLPNSKQNPDYQSFSRMELEKFIEFAVNRRVRVRLQELGEKRRNRATRSLRTAQPEAPEFFEAEDILYSKYYCGILYFCVKWKNYPGEETWEPAYCMSLCTQLISNFNHRHVRVAPPNLPPFPYESRNESPEVTEYDLADDWHNLAETTELDTESISMPSIEPEQGFVPLATSPAIANALSRSQKKANVAVRKEMVLFLQNIVVVDESSNLYLEAIEACIRKKFPDSMANLQSLPTLAAFLGKVVKQAFPGCKKGRLRTGPSYNRQQPVFYHHLKLLVDS